MKFLNIIKSGLVIAIILFGCYLNNSFSQATYHFVEMVLYKTLTPLILLFMEIGSEV